MLLLLLPFDELEGVEYKTTEGSSDSAFLHDEEEEVDGVTILRVRR